MNLKYVVSEQMLLDNGSGNPLFHLGMSIVLCVQKHCEVKMKNVHIVVRGGSIIQAVLTTENEQDKKTVENILVECPVVNALAFRVIVSIVKKEPGRPKKEPKGEEVKNGICKTM